MREAHSILRRMIMAVGLVVGLILVFFAIRLLLLRQDVGQYRAYWQQRADEPVPDQALYYVAFGDSAAQGLGASQPAKGYVGLIAQALQNDTRRPVHVINLSVSGAKVADIAAQLEAMHQLALPPGTIYTLSIGANDMDGYEAAVFRERMDELLARMPKNTVVADIAYFGGGRKRYLEPRVREANDTIRQLVVQHGLRLAPLYATTKAHDHFTVHSVDFLHPSDKGYRNWADAFLAGLGYGH